MARQRFGMPDEAAGPPASLAQLRAESAEGTAAAETESRANNATAVAEAEADRVRAETPLGEADPAAEAWMRAVDALVREALGPLPRVRYTGLGKVLTVNRAARTCTAILASDRDATVAANRVIRSGAGSPKIGETYPVFQAYQLPPPERSLLEGPVPAGDPWLHAPKTAQSWLYYITHPEGGRRSQRTVYKVLVPDQAQPSENWTPAAGDTAAHPGRTVPYGALYLATPPTVQTQEQPPNFAPSPPTSIGSSRSVDTAKDMVVDRVAYQTSNTSPGGAFTVQDERFDLRVELIPGTTTTVKTGLYSSRAIWTPYTNSPAGYFPFPIRYADHSLFEAHGFQALADTALARVGDLVAVWLIVHHYPEDVGPVFPVIDTGNGESSIAFRPWYVAHPTQVVLWVSVNGAPARRVDIANPLAWTANTQNLIRLRQREDGTFLAAGAWHASEQWVAAGQGFSIQRSADIGFLGRSVDGVTWTWQPLQAPANRIEAMSNDGRVIVASRWESSAGGASVSGVTARYISRDYGVSWGALPRLLPHMATWQELDELASNLIDLPV